MKLKAFILLRLFAAPFAPVQYFNNRELSKNKLLLAYLPFFSILTITVVLHYLHFSSFTFRHSHLVVILGHYLETAAALFLRFMILSYLLQYAVTQRSGAKLNMIELFHLSAASYLPFIFSNLLASVDLYFFGFGYIVYLWSLIIFSIGLRYLVKMSHWRAFGLVIGCHILYFVLRVPFWGFRFPTFN